LLDAADIEIRVMLPFHGSQGLVYVDSKQQQTDATPAESDHSIYKGNCDCRGMHKQRFYMYQTYIFFPFASIVCGDLEMHKRGGNVGGK